MKTFFFRLIKRVGYKFINKISDDHLLINATGSGLYDKSIIDIIKKIDDPYPYFRGLVSEITNETKLVKYHQPKDQRAEQKIIFTRYMILEYLVSLNILKFL